MSNKHVRKPRTIQEAFDSRDAYIFSKKEGTLKSTTGKLEIKQARFGASKPQEKPRHYKVPFTEQQAREICNHYGYKLDLKK